MVQPDEDDPAWFASVAVLDEGGYEIVRRDASGREHDVVTEPGIGTIARDPILWLAARDFPGRSARRTFDTFQNTRQTR